MDYEWDPAKEAANVKRHGVEFAEAVIALEDELAVTIADPDAGDEERFISLGRDAMGRILVTVYTPRRESIRVISSRRATRTERRHYEESR